MANSLSSYNTFVPLTKIKSAELNTNFSTIRDGAPFWQKYTVSYSSFSALGAVATGAVTLVSLTAGEVVNAVMVKHTTALSGGAISAAIARVGKTGTDDYYTDDFNVFQAVASTAAQKTGALNCEFSSTTLILTVSLTGANLSALAAGSIDVYVQKNTIP